MEQAAWRGMPYYDVFWRKRHLTRRELRSVYANYYTYVFWALVISLVILLDLHGFAERVSVTALVVYSVSLAFFTFGFYFLAGLVGLKLSERYSWFFVIFPLVGFVGVTFATYVVEFGMSGYFGGKFTIANAAEKLPVNLILTLVLETLYLTFVLPIAMKSYDPLKNAPLPPMPPSCDTVNIVGKTYFCKQLVSVSSQDHYVRIRTSEGENMVRARLSDLIGLLECQNGIQPHRSHWVSRRAVAGMMSRGGQKFLELRDGSELPIARGRIGDVQEWLETPIS